MTPIKCIAEGREDSRRQGSGYLLNGEVHSHEIVGIIDVLGAGVDGERLGCGVGVPWLGYACGACAYCRTGSENLCERPLFTGYTRDGGFATLVVADVGFAFDLGDEADPVALVRLLCASLIGWRSLKRAGEGQRIGLYGFGAAANIVAQVCAWQGREVYAFTRPGDSVAQRFASRLSAEWAGGSDEMPPVPRAGRRARIPCGAGDLAKRVRRHGRRKEARPLSRSPTGTRPFPAPARETRRLRLQDAADPRA